MHVPVAMYQPYAAVYIFLCLNFTLDHASHEIKAITVRLEVNILRLRRGTSP